MIEIKLKKCVLVLSEAELLSLLAHDKELWQTALRRGKGTMRYKKAQERSGKSV